MGFCLFLFIFIFETVSNCSTALPWIEDTSLPLVTSAEFTVKSQLYGQMFLPASPTF